MSRIKLKDEAKSAIQKKAPDPEPIEIPVDEAELRHVVVSPDGSIVAIYDRGYMDGDEFRKVDVLRPKIQDQDLADKVIKKVEKAIKKAEE